MGKGPNTGRKWRLGVEVYLGPVQCGTRFLGLAGIIILFYFMPPVSCTSKGHREKKKKNDTQNINMQVSEPDPNSPLKRKEKDHSNGSFSYHTKLEVSHNPPTYSLLGVLEVCGDNALSSLYLLHVYQSQRFLKSF